MNRLVFLDVDDTFLSPPYEAVRKACAILGKKLPSEEEVLNRSQIHFYDAFPKIFRSKREMWLCGLMALPFGYFKSQKLLKVDAGRLGQALSDDRVYLVSKNPPSFTRWRIRRLKELLGVNVGDRYIACGPMFAKGPSKLTIIRRIASQRGVELQNCLLIDDSVENLEAAAAEGVATVLVGTTWNTEATKFRRVDTEDVPREVENHLTELKVGAQKTQFLIPPLSLGLLSSMLWFFLKRSFLYSEYPPSPNRLIPIARNTLVSFLFRDPHAFVRGRMNALLEAQVSLDSIRIVPLGGACECLRLSSPQKDRVIGYLAKDREHAVLLLRQAAREQLEALGITFAPKSLFYFVELNRTKEVERILKSDQVARAVSQFSAAHGSSVDDVWRSARRYATELAAARIYLGCFFSAFSVGVVFRRVFSSVRVNLSPKIKEYETDYFLVYASIHRSYLDSGILYWVLARSSMYYPFTVAADKMRRVWIGRLGALTGAVFIQRRFVDNVYAAVLAEHMIGLQTHGGSLEVFLEGQRSRSGLTLPPKKGILRSFWQNIDPAGTGKKIAIVPVSFAYNKLPESEMLVRERYEERVRDGNASLREMADMIVKKSRKKTFYQKVRSVIRRLTNAAISECQINFGDPIELNRDHDLSESDGDLMLQGYLNQTMFAINNITAVFPSSLLCLGILGAEDYHLDRSSAVRFIGLGRSLLAICGTATQRELLEEQSNERHVTDFVTLPFVNRKFKRYGIIDGSILSFSDLDIERSSYYRNNILHFFVLPSLIASVLLESRVGRIEEMHRFLDHMFGQLATKYFLPNIGNAKAYIDRVLGLLADQGLIVISNQSYTISAESPEFSSLRVLARIGGDIVKDDLFEVFENFRRSYHRMEVDAAVEIRALRRTSARSGRILNCSDVGFFLQCREPLEIGDSVQVYLDENTDAAYAGQVVRVDVDGVGVRALDPNIVFGAEDRRAAPRSPIDRDGQVVIQKTMSLEAKVRNISPNGALIATEFSFRPGDRLMMTLRGDHLILDIACVVSRTLEAGVGVRFVDLSAESEAELILFIAGVLSDPKAKESMNSWRIASTA